MAPYLSPAALAALKARLKPEDAGNDPYNWREISAMSADLDHRYQPVAMVWRPGQRDGAIWFGEYPGNFSRTSSRRAAVRFYRYEGPVEISPPGGAGSPGSSPLAGRLVGPGPKSPARPLVKRPEPETRMETEFETLEPVKESEREKLSLALSDPRWCEGEYGFNEEADASVAICIPPEAKGRKKVMFEYFARKEGDPRTQERIGQVEGFAEADIGESRATARLPLFIPNFLDRNDTDAKVEYYFKAKHTLSEPIDSSQSKEGVKTASKMADLLIDTHILEGVTFGFGSSFLHPEQLPKLKALGEKIGAWKEKHPEGKLALFGHTDAVGKESYNKTLSERRARSVHAFLMREASAWEDLYKEESWGLRITQTLLKHCGHDPGAIDGQDGPKTQVAAKTFQEKSGLSVDGIAGPRTREGLFKAFMADGPELGLKKKDFDSIDGQPFMGCSEFNLIEATEKRSEANRRVTVALVKSSKSFPVQYPCKHGDCGPCQGQVKKPGERRTAGFGCGFYDKLVVEGAGASPISSNYTGGKLRLSILGVDSNPLQEATLMNSNETQINPSADGWCETQCPSEDEEQEFIIKTGEITMYWNPDKNTGVA